jgi:DNA polymerase-3 subunit gamma/tau
MSYQVLARKWRPRTFREMVGQGHVLQTLIHALDNQRLHHAYLFTGTRGVGKTTIARILARCLNCEGGITSTPCGQCLACREINEGRFLDLIEVDAASRTKVEDTRELLENVQYAPSRGRFKIYLIDEVHMLSNHSFNALLKTLEEPPPHVKFLLATTDPQKLPVTVLSRCLQFSLKNLSPEKLVEHMKHILTEEGLAFEEPALWALGRAAQGSVRDCLTLLDQAIGFCKGSLTAAAVGEFLGSIDQAVITRLMEALIAKDAAELLRSVRSAAENSPDFAAILQELLSWLHRVAIAQAVPDAIDNSQGDREAVLAHAEALSPENIQLYYQMALKGREDLPFAPSAQSGLEMTLLRMLAFTPQTGPRAAAPSPAGDLAAAGQKKKLIEPRSAPPATAPSLQEATSAALAGKPLALAGLSAETWPLLFAQLGLSGVTRSVASHCCVRRVADSDVELTLDANNAALFNEEHRRRIETALREYFRQDIVLTVTPGRCAAETPAARRLRLEDERRLAAVQDFTHDPVVKALMERFGAEVQYDTIVPLTPQRH